MAGFRLFRRAHAGGGSHRGQPFFLIGRRDVSPVPSGSKFSTQRKRALEGEACLINRIVPVRFTLLAGVTLDEGAEERKCAECNEAGASFLPSSPSLSLFVNATEAQTDISFLPHNKRASVNTQDADRGSSPATPPPPSQYDMYAALRRESSRPPFR